MWPTYLIALASLSKVVVVVVTPDTWSLAAIYKTMTQTSIHQIVLKKNHLQAHTHTGCQVVYQERKNLCKGHSWRSTEG